jgi:hypothetical protein
MSWKAYVHLAFDEIRLAGAHSRHVSRRLVAALQDPLEVVPAQRRPVLANQLRPLTDPVAQSDRDQADREMATEPDRQGIGVAINGPTSRQRSGGIYRWPVTTIERIGVTAPRALAFHRGDRQQPNGRQADGPRV